LLLKTDLKVITRPAIVFSARSKPGIFPFNLLLPHVAHSPSFFGHPDQFVQFNRQVRPDTSFSSLVTASKSSSVCSVAFWFGKVPFATLSFTLRPRSVAFVGNRVQTSSALVPSNSFAAQREKCFSSFSFPFVLRYFRSFASRAALRPTHVMLYFLDIPVSANLLEVHILHSICNLCSLFQLFLTCIQGTYASFDSSPYYVIASSDTYGDHDDFDSIPVPIKIDIGGAPFKGFLVTAVDSFTGDRLGSFTKVEGSALLPCSAITHTDNKLKKFASFLWNAPKNKKGRVTFM
jgi:hypothetical protein